MLCSSLKPSLLQCRQVREPFPAGVKQAGVDTLVMKHFLSGFSDADAALILKHCAQVLTPDGRILLLQARLLPLSWCLGGGCSAY